MDGEFCVNIWFAVSEEDGLVRSVAGRAYFLTGSDDQKTAALKALASTDYVLARKVDIPETHTAILPDGSEVGGAVSPAALEDMASPVFMALYKELDATISDATLWGYETANSLDRIPENPLYVITPLLEDEFGQVGLLR